MEKIEVFKVEVPKKKPNMDKLAIGFLADILYIKGIICFEEFSDMQDVAQASDLGTIVDKMLKQEYNAHKRGEGYIGIAD